MKKSAILLLMCMVCISAMAQRVTASFQETSMSKALLEIERQCKDCRINFIYDELQDFTVTQNVDDRPLLDALHLVAGFYPIRITRQGRIYSVECVQKEQTKVTGRILDEKGQPFPLVNVVLLTPEDSAFINGGVSNNNGDVVIPCERKEVIAKVSFIGYRTQYLHCQDGSLGTICMSEDAIALKQVKVKGEIPQYKMARGGMTVEVQNSILSQVGTANDVLSQLPRVSMGNDGTISVFAKGTPEIYINNRKVMDPKELQQLKSTDIKDIDIITNPGAQYDAEVKSVIRIHTLKPQGEGLSFRTDTYTKYNSFWAGGQETQVKYRKNGLEVFANISYSSSCYVEDNTLQQDISSVNHVVVDQYLWTKIKTSYGNLKAGFSYDVNPNHSFGASVETNRQFTFDAYTRDGAQEVYVNDALDGKVKSNWYMKSGSSPLTMVNGYYTGKAGEMSVDANVTGYWSESSTDKTVVEESQELGDRVVTADNDQHSMLLAGKLVCTYPLGNGSLSFGTELSHTESKGEYKNREQVVASSLTEMKEDHTAGFAEYTYPKGDWSYNVGLRYEYVSSRYYDFGKYREDASRDYGNFFPSASVSWNKDKWGAQFGYVCKTSRPSYRSLRNEVQYDNRFMYEGGNPYLRPSMSHDLDAELTYKWFSLSAGYSYTKDVMVWSTTLYNDQEDIAFTRNLNFDHLSEVYVSAVVSPKFDWYQPTLEVDYMQEFFDAQGFGSILNTDKPYFSVMLNNRFVLGHDFSAFLRIRQNTDHYSGFTFREHTTNLSAQFVKSFFNKALTVNLQLNDLLGQNEVMKMYGIRSMIAKDCYNYTRSALVTVTYNLNASKSKYKGTGAGNAEKRRL